MTELAVWCGFLGAWLLVAGPVYQASIELLDEDIERDRINDVLTNVPKPPPVSPWWWLVPPVRYWLERRRQHTHRDRVIAALTPEDVEAFVSFSSKAAGWLFVGAGGLLIATKETWELVEHHEWPAWLFWVLVVVMATLSAANTAARNARSRSMRESNAAARAGAGRPEAG